MQITETWIHCENPNNYWFHMRKLKWDQVKCLRRISATLAANRRQLCRGLAWPFGEQESGMGLSAVSWSSYCTMGPDSSLEGQKLLMWIWTGGMQKPSWHL